MKYESIGRNIRKYRIAKKMRQEDLAEETGLSTTYIGMVERGEKIPSLETFLSILNALNISADLVLYDELNTGYEIKISLLNEKLEKLSQHDKTLVYDVIDTIIIHKVNIHK